VEESIVQKGVVTENQAKFSKTSWHSENKKAPKSTITFFISSQYPPCLAYAATVKLFENCRFLEMPLKEDNVCLVYGFVFYISARFPLM